MSRFALHLFIKFAHKSLLCAAMVIYFVVARAQAPLRTSLAEMPPSVATVIFYAEGGLWKGSAMQILTMGAAKSDAASMAFMFDGPQRFGFLLPRRFIAIMVPPGEHIFSASQTKKHADTKEPLTLTTESGKIYYIRLTATTGSLKPLVSGTQGHLKQVSCSDFAADAEHDKLKTIEPRRVEPAFLNQLIVLKDIPPCA